MMILISTGGIYYGMTQKENMQEAQYRQYVESPDRSNLTPEALSYKDTYNLFVRDYLGNDPSQSMMGGYFYNDDFCSIYPNVSATCTLINIEGQEYRMADFLADEINVREDYVVFRKPSSRELYLYNMVSKKTSLLDFSDVGQFVICEEEYYYIDLSESSLVQFNNTTKEKNVIVEDGVLSFAVAGNDLLILDSSHTLSTFNLVNHTSTILGKNINTFIFNGTLWLQNNTSVYKKELDNKNIEKVELGLQCNRLLGVIESGIIFESDGGVYLFDFASSVISQMGTDIFVGMANDMVLWYSVTNNSYRIEQISKNNPS